MLYNAGIDSCPQCTANKQAPNASFHMLTNYSHTHLGMFLSELLISLNSVSWLSTHLLFHQQNDILFPNNTATRANGFFFFCQDFELRYYGEWIAVSDFSRKLQEMPAVFFPSCGRHLTNVQTSKSSLKRILMIFIVFDRHVHNCLLSSFKRHYSALFILQFKTGFIENKVTFLEQLQYSFNIHSTSVFRCMG